MGATVLAWMGLIGVLLVSLHWALSAARARGRRLPAPLLRLLHALEQIPQSLSADTRAERRRAERLRVARQHREAIARDSRAHPLDDDEKVTEPPVVEWDGNVARPQFGGERRRQRPHNLH